MANESEARNNGTGCGEDRGTWLRGTWKAARECLAILVSIVAIVAFVVPLVVTAAVFVLATVACVAVAFVDLVVSCIIVTVALLVAPDGIKKVVESVKERISDKAA